MGIEFHINEIDTAALGATVLDVRGVGSPDEFLRLEKEYVDAFRPYYAVYKLDIEELSHVHFLESQGFRFLETQLRLNKVFGAPYDVSRFPYHYGPVETEEDLEKTLEIASTIFVDDRFSIDPIIPPEVSGKRYRQYAIQSFHRPDERLNALRRNETGQIVAFGSHKRVSDDEALILIGGVAQEFKGKGLGVIHNYFWLNELKREGSKRLVTHVSARNYAIMGLEIAGLGYKPVRSFTILRKIYE